MLIEKIGYSYNDVTLIPSEISKISSRSECNPFVSETENWLPIIASPMASIVNENNLQSFIDNGIIPIVPRNINLDKRKVLMNDQQWVALSLMEFKDLFINHADERDDDFRSHFFVVIDIANGHMKSLYANCIVAKQKAEEYGYKLTIMTGNIANPKTYKWICKNATYKTKDNKKKCAVDFIRVGIGGGSGCITTSNVSIHYPQASLIDKCYQVKKELENKFIEIEINAYNTKSKKQYDYELPKIVADGGIRNYDHVIKALALGADYVMIGSVFAQCIESAGEKTIKSLSTKLPLRFPIERYKDFSVDSKGNWSAYYNDKGIKEIIKPWVETLERSKKELDEQLYPHAQSNYEFNKNKYEEKLKELKEQKILGHIDVKFFGMASADGQKAIDGEKKKTAEGITKWLPVKYTLSGWVENMISYLRSAMSYTDCKTLKEFIGTPELIVNSISEIQAVNK